MVYAWARWLKPALQADPFVAARLIEVPGWETRGRGPELGFSFLPSGILDHHTACLIRTGHDPQSCLNGILAGNGLAPPPVSQLLGTFTKPGVRWTGNNPDPHIIIVAAGRCNHAGGGVWPWGAPAGNGSAIGIEWCGPPAGGWPDVVIELRARVDVAILRWNGWAARQITTHWEYVQPVRPGAKIDPSGSWSAEKGLGQTAHWNPDTWRARVGSIPAPTPPTPPPPSPSPSGDDVNWNPDAATVAGVVDPPPVADVLAGKVNDWQTIAYAKAIQRKAGLPVTGKLDQATQLAVNSFMDGG